MRIGIALALASALLFGASTPFAKLLLGAVNPWLMAGYYDVLTRNAFGNFRTLLEDVTKNPAMALYLDSMCNDKETATRVPNENATKCSISRAITGDSVMRHERTVTLLISA